MIACCSFRSAAMGAALVTLLAGTLAGCAEGGGGDPDGSVDDGSRPRDRDMSEPDRRRPDPRETERDPADCGGSGEPACNGSECASGLVCSGGRCTSSTTCGREGSECCQGAACQSGLVCDAANNRCADPDDCGGSGERCCSQGRCGAGLACISGSCRSVDDAPCGRLDRPCCSGDRCASCLQCRDGECKTPTPCGGPRERCCNDGDPEPYECRDDLVCGDDGRCGSAEDPEDNAGRLNGPCRSGPDPCNGELRCCDSTCVNTDTNAEHCGGCDDPCDTECRGGECEPEPDCGGLGEACCEPDDRGYDCEGALDCGDDSRCARPEDEEPTCNPLAEMCSGESECCGGSGSQVSCRVGFIEANNEICCGEVGASCGGQPECCGKMPCTDGRCACVGDGGGCRETDDCCSGFRCVDEGGSKKCRTSGTDPCAELSDDGCDACLDSPQECIWCGDGAGACVRGTASAPASGTCDAIIADGAQCDLADSPCTPHRGDCSACVAEDGCAYCGSNGACLPEGETGSCDAVSEEAQCQAANCRELDGEGQCGACMARDGCAFCRSTNECHLVAEIDQASECEDCRGCRSETDTCEDDPCTQHEDCKACARDTQCGWCGQPGAEGCRLADPARPDERPQSAGCAPGFWFGTEAVCGSDPCTQYGGSGTDVDRCNDCVAHAGCGWCASLGICASGTTDGPPDSLGCVDEDNWWQTAPSECRPFCPGVTDGCTACTDTDGCGWCDSRDSCEPGDGSESFFGDCLDWDWSSVTSGLTCDNVQACGELDNACMDCLAHDDGYCGWCHGTQSCVEVRGDRVARPIDCEGAFQPNMCMPDQDPCDGPTSCDACIFQFDGESCGWCAATGQCLSGTSAGPATDNCSDWLWFACG